MHHLKVLIELIVTGTGAFAITYGALVWPLMRENARLRREIERQERLSRALEAHQKREEEARFERLMSGVGLERKRTA
jgi:hypothetical protein